MSSQSFSSKIKLRMFCVNLVSWLWNSRLFILTDQGIGYTKESWEQTNSKSKPDSNSQGVSFREVLTFDNTIKILVGKKYTGFRLCIFIKTTSRTLKMSFENSFQLCDWIVALEDAIIANPYCKLNRFESFSPVRLSNKVNWYINARQYFRDISLELEAAKSEIFITDWWICPQIYLQRPVRVENGIPVDYHWRLDTVLLRAAKRGVKINILLYKEFEGALMHKSIVSMTYLQKLHPNIQIVRHPGALISLWSHHEKLVIVDQKVGFLGGLDLCFGRYDWSEYPLFDPGSKKEGYSYFPGQDYSNVRIKDFEDVDQYNKTLIDRNEVPRMPWRDIALRVEGPATLDLIRHFIQYWNFAKYDIEGKSKQKNFLFKNSSREKNQSNFVFSSQVSSTENSVFDRKNAPTKIINFLDPDFTRETSVSNFDKVKNSIKNLVNINIFSKAAVPENQRNKDDQEKPNFSEEAMLLIEKGNLNTQKLIKEKSNEDTDVIFSGYF